MKKSVYLTVTFLAILFTGHLISCNQKNSFRIHDQGMIDSLTKVNETLQSHINDMEGFITSLSQTMDSIEIQEKELVAEGDIEKREKKSKATIINHLKRFKETIERQKQMIEKLEKQLSAKDDETSLKMLQIVTFYKKELEAKDKTIASLQMSIATNKRDIQNLQASVDQLLLTTKDQDETIKEQVSILNNQTSMINVCYVKMGTKNELKKDGIISGGFLKKNKLDYSRFTPSHFTEMDMRNCNDIPINSSNPKILTQMPVSSYEIIKEDKGSYLHIKDPNLFWSISKYLVIQL